MSNYNKIATDVMEALGGKENVQSLTHCATRLRVMVVEEEKIDKARVENIELVKGAFFNSGQYQIIFGTGTVNKVYDAVTALGDVTEVSTTEMKEATKQQGNFFQRMSRTFGDVFVPIIPVLVATGLFMGLRGLLTNETFLGLFNLSASGIDAEFIRYTKILTDTAFAFLPVLISWSSFKVFGGNPVLGIVLGLMLVSPELPNAYVVASGDASALSWLGIPIVGYQGTVLPAFFVGLIGSKLEKRLRKLVPDTFDLLVTPFVTFLVMSILGLLVIGPVFHSVEVYVLEATKWILNLPFGLAGLILGGTQQLIVVTGVHHIFNFLESQFGQANPFNPIISAATAGQVGAVLAVGFKTADKKLKALAFPSALSAALGITEPAIFGVNLRYGKPFIMGLVGGAAGGFIASLLQLKATGMSVTVLPGILLFLNEQILGYLLAIIVACAVSFVLTYTIGYDDKMKK